MYNRKKYREKLYYALSQLPCTAEIGDILITAARSESYNSETFRKKITELHATLKTLFPAGAYIVTRSDEGRLHAHVAVKMPVSSLEYDWVAFDQAKFFYFLYKKDRSGHHLEKYRYYKEKHEASLPEQWQLMNKKLMAIGEKLGLGRIFMTPIRKNKECYTYYLTSNIPKTRQERDKYLHIFYSWGLQKTGKFQVRDTYTADYRRKLKKIVEGLQLTDENYTMTLRSMLGAKWHSRIEDIVRYADNLPAALETKYTELKSAIALHLLRS